MPSIIFHVVEPPDGTVVPGWVNDLTSFSRWTESPEFPETGRVSYVQGDVWMDMSLEDLFTHNLLKVEIAAVLTSIVKAAALGYVFGDGARVRNEAAELSVEPDAVYVSFEAIRSAHVRLTEGNEDGFVYVDGTPEVVAEVVRPSSVQKDTVDLRQAYFDADIPEYWLVDARQAPVSFELLKRGPRGYSATRAQAGGWLKSAVFGKSFRITQAADPLGNTQFTLEHRD
jgi:Uma2 family endonuclease